MLFILSLNLNIFILSPYDLALNTYEYLTVNTHDFFNLFFLNSIKGLIITDSILLYFFGLQNWDILIFLLTFVLIIFSLINFFI